MTTYVSVENLSSLMLQSNEEPNTNHEGTEETVPS
jgi:hypothetical protein